ncbi:hypothetical protein SI65_02501 [Aspergillus cristatus]|uniref:Uncharacterized protein n=1 Tax=Aspergillus cristatus TaxID=573508 RepID=A0A1E3BL75_ASPCR|nr:hypothetical protein SI65_02501 [Aspergillus cristatus]
MSGPKQSHQHQEYIDLPMASKIGMDDCINCVRKVDTINTSMASQPPRTLGDPTPLGLGGFALTTFVLALVNLQTQGIKVPNIIIRPSLAYDGVAQFAAGMWYSGHGLSSQ